MATHRHGAGSSPRGRGKPKAPKTVKLTVRLIPARAGKTPWTASLSISRPAHPRAGGENAINSMGAGIAEGSSPRGRGKPYGLDSQLALSGLIPARAGKTPSTASLSTSRPAHPRAGGENRMSLIAWSRATGSSPRGRGKLVPWPAYHSAARLIPARAGKTSLTCSLTPPPRAHPRAGGENLLLRGGENRREGSSPRGRGKQKLPGVPAPGSRLIPARAGKTHYQPGPPRSLTAHPRAGGENTF